MTGLGKQIRLVPSLIVLAIALLSAIWAYSYFNNSFGKEPIRVGILHSLTGTMAVSELPVVDATLLAIEEINEAGGLLGRVIEPVVADGKSDGPTFAREAERLIVHEKVSVVFGCWTSASRKTVRPVFEKYDHLLFYPVQYEGLEQSPNIVYLGAAPNQQIIPAIMWSMENLGRRFFLVGSDYVFPRTANAIITEYVKARQGEIVGEEYILLGHNDASEVVQTILDVQPDVILNTLNGDINISFFEELRRAGIRPDNIPVMSLSIGENELRAMDTDNIDGDYACWNYFQSIESERNDEFVTAFKEMYGEDRVLGDPMEAAYVGVYLWAQAVRLQGSDAANKVNQVICGGSMSAPEGIVSIDIRNRHLWKTVRIGKIRREGQFDIVWTSDKPVHPNPFPGQRTKIEWNAFLGALYERWGGNWTNVGN